MANIAITGLVADTAPVLTDLVESVKDPGGTPLSRKVTHADVVESTFQVASAVPSSNTDLTKFTSVTPLFGVFLDEATNRLYVFQAGKWQQLVTGDF